MKRKLFLLALLAQITSISVMAYDAEIDGIYYEFFGTEATVTYQRSKGGTYLSNYEGDVVIPSNVTYQGKTYEVTTIGSDAFYKCEKLTSVTIPEGVTSIGNGAFRYCSSLTSINIPESVTEIHAYAFSDTPWFSNQPDGVVYVGKVAYKYKGKMPENTSIEIQEGTVSISEYAFKDCTGLTSIVVPESVINISYGAFDGTTWFANLPDGVVYAGKVVYKYKGEMPENTTIEIKEGTLGIADYAFDGNINLLSVTIPEGVTTIGDFAFRDCEGLTSVAIPESVNSIGAGAFESCYVLYSIIIPEGVKSIGSHTFLNCFTLSSITIPASVTTIGSDAFRQCISLRSIIIPEGVTTIGDYVFDGCGDLSSIFISKSVTSLGIRAISHSINLSSIVVQEGNPVYDSRNECNAIIETASNTLIVGCKNTIIPEGVTSIGNYAFYQCSGLKSLSIPKTVTSIDTYTFYHCSGLTSIVVEDGNPVYDSRDNSNALIETASNALIIGCKNTIIPEGVVRICDDAFYQCMGLTSISIPDGVTSIGNEAFYNSSDLASIAIPETVNSIGVRAFDRTAWFDSQPDGMVYAGKVAYNYKGTMPDDTMIEIQYGTLGIAGSAFYNCTGLTSINIPNTVITIGDGAFSSCKNIVSISIPNSVTSIGNYAFNGCRNLTFINLPEGVTNIGYSTFGDCSSLTSITIPKSVSKIGDSAFADCSALSSITIQEGLSSIGSSAFWWCTALTSINIPEGVTSIGTLAFYNCSRLASVKIPESVSEMGYRAFDTRSFVSVKVGMRNPISLLPETFWFGGSTLYVPKGSKSAYQAADYWQNFKYIIECDYVTIADRSIIEDKTATMEIGLKNFDSNIVAFQMDLTLPEGVGIDKAGCSLSSRIIDEEQKLTIGKLEDGKYRLTSSSLSLTPISGNNGTLLTLKLTAEDGCIGGQATISNILFSTADSERVTMNDETFDIDVMYKVIYKVDGEAYKTVNVVYNTQPTPETEPAKEGYTFGGWSEIPETMPARDVEVTGNFYIYGDVNTDEAVDVVDVIDIARFVVATPSAMFREKLADLNSDNTVNLGDAVVLVNHIAGDQNFVKAMFAPAVPITSNDALSLTQSGNSLSLHLTNGRAYTAFQFDLYVSDETIVKEILLSAERKQGHQLLYNKVENGHYRVAALSTSNRAFLGNAGELLTFAFEGTPDAEVSISNIHFFDTQGNDYAFDELSIDIATGLHDVNVNDNVNDVIFDLQGRKLTKMQRGVNIVNGKKIIKK